MCLGLFAWPGESIRRKKAQATARRGSCTLSAVHEVFDLDAQELLGRELAKLVLDGGMRSQRPVPPWCSVKELSFWKGAASLSGYRKCSSGRTSRSPPA
eukprot:6203209-Pleurochrysis_carterae.AAC.5